LDTPHSAEDRVTDDTTAAGNLPAEEAPETAGTATAETTVAETAETEGRAVSQLIPPVAATGAVLARRWTILRARLNAWWEGEELDPAVPMAEPAPEPGSLDVVAAADLETLHQLDAAGWSVGRMVAAQMVWGQDHTRPGGTKIAMEMVKPVGLDPSMSVLDLSAGMGATARLFAKSMGAWVTGMEPSKTLAEQGMEKSVMAGLSKKAPIKSYDPEELTLPERAYDCIFAREAFFTVKQKARLFKVVTAALKSKGELVFTEFMLRSPGLETEAIRRWTEGEPVPVQPWALDEVLEELRKHRLDIRVTEDITTDYRNLIVRALEALIERHRTMSRVDHEIGQHLLAEAELWTRRVEAFDSGDLRVYRIFARMPVLDGGGPRTMSNW